MGLVLPLCWHLFELGEMTILGLPNLDLAQDKWSDDLLPVIEASPGMRRYLPTRGEGSRGGAVKREIRFTNGASLRFMTGGSSDKARAGKTCRVAAMTEIDGMDQPGAGSRESDPISQIEGRTRSFGRKGKRIYLECTVSIEEGRIWQEVQVTGTGSRLARPCPYCGDWVTPEREHLVGWQNAETEEAAALQATWTCPACAHPWTDEDRVAAGQHAVLLHRGQTIDHAGQIHGPTPETATFGLRWSAIDSIFQTAADLGAEEWRARRRAHRANAETELRQWIWALPAIPLVVDITPLDPDAVLQRTSGAKRGVIPDDTIGVAIGVDTGKRKLHWVALAARRDGRVSVIEYGEQSVESDRLGVTAGLRAALQQLREYWAAGWRDAQAKPWTPQQVWIDSGYYQHTDGVYEFCAVANAGCEPGREIYRPSKGYGEKQKGIGRYFAPRTRNADVLYVGSQYHLSRIRRAGRLVPGVVLCHVNADGWKSEVHQRLAQPADQPGALTLYETADAGEHGEFRDHLLAERQIETWIAGRGNVVTWEAIEGRPNHYLDALYDGLAAADFLSSQIAEAATAAKQPQTWFKKGKRR